MKNAIYTGLSGMMAYSRGLDVISNNVANLNTPGFKAAESIFRDLVFRGASSAIADGSARSSPGAGVSADDTRTSFSRGDLRSTNDPLDAAVDGSGFFVLDRDGELLYTRAGQFEVDPDGVLVDRRTKARVMFATDAASMGSLDITPHRVFPPVATTEVRLVGNLSRGNSSPTHDTQTITVIDPAGGRQPLTIRFVRNDTDPLRWTAEVRDANNTVLGTGQLVFNADGTPSAESVSFRATVAPTGVPPFEVSFSLGAANTFSGVTSLAGSAASQVQALRQDGVELGSLVQFAFTDRGELKLLYSNGESRIIGRVLLARFATSDELRSIGDGLYATRSDDTPPIGTALSNGLGHVVGGQIELSNVDLTSQFTDLIIIQRGYQASSQVASMAGEMMKQLIDMSSGR